MPGAIGLGFSPARRTTPGFARMRFGFKVKLKWSGFKVSLTSQLGCDQLSVIDFFNIMILIASKRISCSFKNKLSDLDW